MEKLFYWIRNSVYRYAQYSKKAMAFSVKTTQRRVDTSKHNAALREAVSAKAKLQNAVEYAENHATLVELVTILAIAEDEYDKLLNPSNQSESLRTVLSVHNTLYRQYIAAIGGNPFARGCNIAAYERKKVVTSQLDNLYAIAYTTITEGKGCTLLQIEDISVLELELADLDKDPSSSPFHSRPENPEHVAARALYEEIDAELLRTNVEYSEHIEKISQMHDQMYHIKKTINAPKRAILFAEMALVRAYADVYHTYIKVIMPHSMQR
jgi:hypothetical protein